jgi:hypothetical protein
MNLEEHIAVFIDVDPQMDTRYSKMGSQATKLDVALKGANLLRQLKGQWRHHILCVNAWGDTITTNVPLGPAPRHPGISGIKTTSSPCLPAEMSAVLLHAYQQMSSSPATARWRIILVHGRTRAVPILSPDVAEVLKGCGMCIDSLYLHTHAEAAEGPDAAEVYRTYCTMAHLTRGYALRACSDENAAMRCFAILCANAATRPPQEHYASTRDYHDPSPSIRVDPLEYVEPHSPEVLETVPDDKFTKAQRTPLPQSPESKSPSKSPPVSPRHLLEFSPRSRSDAVMLSTIDDEPHTQAPANETPRGPAVVDTEKSPSPPRDPLDDLFAPLLPPPPPTALDGTPDMEADSLSPKPPL